MAASSKATRAGHAYLNRWAALFDDAGGLEWKLVFSLKPILSAFEERLGFALAAAVRDAEGLEAWLENRWNCIKAAQVALQFQIAKRGLTADDFLNRMIDVQIEPGGAKRLRQAIVLAIAKAYSTSEFGLRHWMNPAPRT